MDIIDEQVREDILIANGSIVVSASAGSGKTTIMIKKISKVLNEILDHRTVAAITFTVKATEEIKKKARDLEVIKDFVAMTNDSFVEHEIIRPFLVDAFGEEYQREFLVSYDVSKRFDSFDEGMEVLRVRNTLGTYRNNNHNFKFELAKKILENSQAAREYFRAKYSTIFLDEYQDSDMNMHELFMYMKNVLGIELFIVGDGKQAIYLWRGAQRNIFELLEAEGIQSFELITNFRSDFEIVNYANLMHNNSQFDNNRAENVSHVIHCLTNNDLNSIDSLFRSGELDINRSVTIIANRNDHAQSIAENLKFYGYNFVFIPRTPIDESSDHSSILKSIACYILDNRYSVYDVADVLRIEQNRSILKWIESLLSPLEQIIPLPPNTSKDEITSSFFRIISRFNEHFGLDITDDEIKLLLETLSNEMFYPAFIKSNDLHKVMTVFGSKGLEFNQVISFSGYYNFSQEGERNNHYVCVTRAENKFVMLEDGRYSNSINVIARNSGITDMKNLYKIIDHT